MKRLLTSLFYSLFVTVLGTTTAQAKMEMGLALGLVQDQNSFSSKNSFQNSLYTGSLYLNVSESSSFLLGFEYSYLTHVYPVSDTETATLISTNPMAGIKFVFGKEDIFAIGLAGSTSVQMSYKLTPGGSEIWSGPGFVGRLTIQPELSNVVRLVASFNYLSTSYTVKSATTEASTKTSVTRSLIIPTIGVSFTF